MQSKGCKPDSIVYNAIIDALWDTGIVWAQQHAALLYRRASARRCVFHTCPRNIKQDVPVLRAKGCISTEQMWPACNTGKLIGDPELATPAQRAKHA